MSWLTEHESWLMPRLGYIRLAAMLALIASFTLLTGNALGDSPITIEAQVSSSSDDAYHAPAVWPNYSSTDTRVYAGQPSGNIVTGGWRWTGLGIPSGAVITAAYVELNQRGYGNNLTTTLSFEDVASPATFTGASTPTSRWASRTTFSTNWFWPKSSPNSWIQTPSLVDGIQELVDSYGGINELALLENGAPAGGSFYHEWYSFDFNPARAAKLHIEYIAGDDETAPVISNVLSTALTTSATIGWTTNEASNSVVNYGTTTALGASESEGTLVTGHTMVLTGLTHSTTYYYEVSSTDFSGNTALDNNGGAYHSFTTAAPPPAPTISNVQVSGIGEDAATISWQTDVASNSVVDYGTTTGLGSSASDGAMVTSHSVSLSGLSAATQHYFQVSSTNETGTTTDTNGGAYYSFVTDAAPTTINISNVQLSDITSTSASVSWTTDVGATSRVERALTAGELGNCPDITTNPPTDDHYCTVWDDQGLKTAHFMALTTLKPNTTYYLRVLSTEPGFVQNGGLIGESYPHSFTTLPSANGTMVDISVSAGSDDAYHAPNAFWPGYSSSGSLIYAGAPSGNAVTGGLRFTGLGIPAGATIREAWVELTQKGYGNGLVTELALEDTASAATFSGGSTPYNRWASNRTSFAVRWAWAHLEPGDRIRTASLVNGIQELVDSYGGINEVVVLENGDEVPSGRYHEWFSVEGGSPATIHIEYTVP